MDVMAMKNRQPLYAGSSDQRAQPMKPAARPSLLLRFCMILLLPSVSAHGEVDTERAITVENRLCRIQFNREDGGLLSITNRPLGDECLKGGDSGAMPFRIFADLTEEFDIKINDIFQLVFDDPKAISRTVIQPNTCRLVDVRRENGLTLHYEGGGLEVRLSVVLQAETGVSDWSLRITNISDKPRDFLVDFPCLDGIRLGADASENLATAMDQAGVVVPAWERAGGVLGESNQLSMQWHAVWDPITQSALGLLFMDPDVYPKRLALAEPRLDLHYFPPVTLQPGESHEVPPVRFLVYKGDWKPSARAYRSWHEDAFARLEPPEWYRRSNGSAGRHFKKAAPGVTADNGVQVVLESFRDLPAAHIRCPIDFPEYAFYSRASISYPAHTDGDNTVREDMGGVEALREGIAGVHRLGLHTQLYIEGYIVYKESELARTGRAEHWAVMHKDGSLIGPYSKQDFYHMCPGAIEWQDHLARTVGELLRETGADGVRLDSLGFYYLPCYNPAHEHETPFGYNDWIRQLLAKVHAEAVSANSNVLFTTEGSADWFSPWVHGALTSRCSRDLPFMRLALGPYRPYIYATGAVWASLSGFPGGGCGSSEISRLDANWLCARYPAHEALVWGDVADEDTQTPDPEIVTHRFVGEDYWAVVAVRPASQELIWPRGTGLSGKHAEYSLTFPGLASQVEDAILCDIETLTWAPLELKCIDKDLRVSLRTNWALIILRRPTGPAVLGFDPLPTLRAGMSTPLRLQTLSAGKPTGSVSVTAPGLTVTPSETAASGGVTIRVPDDAFPGHYAVQVTGENLLGVKRFLVVE